MHTYTKGPFKKRDSIGGAGGFSFSSNEEGASIQKGIVGLRNLGNTCFMNSTLQCITSTSCMLPYWLEDKYKSEINKENPLGWQGKIAEEYGSLVKDIWCGKYRIVVPRNLKQVIGEFEPRFSGYNQQDSSELLAFLLDGIHEDLNRVKKKPYTEAVESKGRHDDEVAKEAWEVHRKRNDSIIVDNFQGLLKSRIVCPTCNKISVTFDPYMFLSVPLPSIKEKVIEVNFVPFNPVKSITTYGVKVPQLGSVMDLKTKLSKQCGVNIQRLVVGEIFSEKVYKFFQNDYMLGDIRPTDKIWSWEVPAMEMEKEQKENDRKPGYKIVELQLIQVKEESNWISKRITAKRIAIPLPLVAPALEKVSGEKIWSQVKQILSPFILPGDSDPFVVRSRTWSGEISDPIPRDEKLVSVEREGLAVEITDVTRLNEERASKIMIDESAPSKAIVSGNLGKESISLAECIDAYTVEETLTEQNAWYCPSCKEFKCASKKFDIYSVPKVLIVHLKRFQYSRLYRDKIDTFVDFPTENFDISRWVIGPQGRAENPIVYDLYGISNHMGGLGGGHYTAYIRNHIDGKWYDMNDSSASSAGSRELKSSAAYVLFYQLRE